LNNKRKHRKLKDEQHGSTIKPVLNQGFHEGQDIPVSYKATAMLPKSGKSHIGDM
jgi:hypothetical protein